MSGIGQVCSDCNGLSSLDVDSCVRCGLAITLGATSAPDKATSLEGEQSIPCGSCSASIPAGHKFCVECGVVVRAKTQSVVEENEELNQEEHASLDEKARLTLIKGDDAEGMTFTLAGEEHLIGRKNTDLLFDNDQYMSPKHANFFYREKRLFVRDEGSSNGVYVKIKKNIELEFGRYFLAGEQILRIEKSVKPEFVPTADGTYAYGTPMPTAYFRIVHVLRGGETAMAIRPKTNMVSIGREGNDLDFPEDPFISGHHAQITTEGDTITLTDLDSKNGTFVKIKDELELFDGDFVFLGQQLFRVDLN